ncbi:MAG: hypothetical protein CMJ83_04155 [Planctomycetes bacterium]|nr:hypothetical protein [Planctomycetota bacterium]
MSRDPVDPIVWERLLAAASPVPGLGIAEGLERRVTALARQRYAAAPMATGLVLAVAAAVLATFLGLIFAGDESETATADQSRREIAEIVLIANDRTEEHLDEIRLTLLELIDAAELVAAGYLQQDAGVRFKLSVRHFLKGGRRGKKIDLRQLPVEGCPAPPRFKSETWVVLFFARGSVPTGQWQVSFDQKKPWEAFVDRVRGFRDGSILPTLLKELDSGEGTAPFAERDRLFEDALSLLVDKRDVRGIEHLLAGAQSAWETRRAIGEIGGVGGPQAAAALTRIRTDPDSTPSMRCTAIGQLGLLGPTFVDDEILGLIVDGEAAHALRLAAIRSVDSAADLRATSRLIAAWSTITDDDGTGPEVEGLDGVKGMYLRTGILDALGSIGAVAAKESKPFLLNIARTGNDYYGYRGQAARALAKFGDRSIIPALRAVMKDESTTGYSKRMINELIEAMK